jgi:peptidoglycan/xylan/chitin deacetylase (PgdA/CDA1 family)
MSRKTPGSALRWVALLCSLALWLSMQVCAAQDEEQDSSRRIKFARWQNGATAAISLSFDDWSPDHWLRGLKLWEDYGYRVTLGITLAKKDKHPEGEGFLQQAFDAGHEIANHTVRHESFLTMTPGQIRYDLGICHDYLLAHVKGLEHIYTVIYPEEAFDAATLKTVTEIGYLFGRTGPLGISEIVMVNDPYKPNFNYLFSWSNQNELTLQQWNDTTEWVMGQGGWLIEECHGIGTPGEPDLGWSPRPEEEFRKHYDHIKRYGDKIWVAPICDVGRYIMERNSTELQVSNQTADSLSLILKPSLDRERFDVPLTVEIPIPERWLRVAATQDGRELDVIVRDGNLAYFQVDPNGGEVLVSKRNLVEAAPENHAAKVN